MYKIFWLSTALILSLFLTSCDGITEDTDSMDNDTTIEEYAGVWYSDYVDENNSLYDGVMIRTFTDHYFSISIDMYIGIKVDVGKGTLKYISGTQVEYHLIYEYSQSEGKFVETNDPVKNATYTLSPDSMTWNVEGEDSVVLSSIDPR